MPDGSNAPFDFYDGFASMSHPKEVPVKKSALPQEPRFNSRFYDVTELRGMFDTRLDVYPTGSSAKRDAVNQRKFGNYSLLIEYQNQSDKPKTQLKTQSDVLRDEFRRIASRFTSLNLRNDTIIIEEPYYELYHCPDEMSGALDAAKSPTLIKELELLRDFETRFLSKRIKEIEALIDVRRIAFSCLWALFPPGELVLLQNTLNVGNPILSCAILQRYEVTRDSSNKMF